MIDPEQEVVKGYLRGFERGVVDPNTFVGKSVAYKHGYMNGVADATGQVNQRAAVSRARWAMIVGGN